MEWEWQFVQIVQMYVRSISYNLPKSEMQFSCVKSANATVLELVPVVLILALI